MSDFLFCFVLLPRHCYSSVMNVRVSFSVSALDRHFYLYFTLFQDINRQTL